MSSYYLDGLQQQIGEANAANGWHDEGDRLRNDAGNVALTSSSFMGAEASGRPKAALRNYYITKLALVMSEAAEAVEELRNGHAVTETYYSGGEGEFLGSQDQYDAHGNRRKPEGVPSEIADIVIRCFDFADEAGFSLGEIILEKLAYNATRGRMHGGKKV